MSVEIGDKETISGGMSIAVFERKSSKLKPECEDSFYVDQDQTVFVVADGISRFRYPFNYSPSARAAQSAAVTIGKVLAERDMIRPREDFLSAFKIANDVIRELNLKEIGSERLPLWESTDYYEDDLAGAVAAVCVLRNNSLHYAFNGDCQIVHLPYKGEIWKAVTPATDRVARSRSVFVHHKENLPEPESGDYEEAWKNYIRLVHNDYRNNPHAELMNSTHVTYSVLNGQSSAVHDIYINSGEQKLASGDIFLLCSDGLNSYINDLGFVSILKSGEIDTLSTYVDNHPKIDKENDDKVCICVRLP